MKTSYRFAWPILLWLCSATWAVVIGNFEGSADGWTVEGSAVFSNSTIGATLGRQSLRIDVPDSGWQTVAKFDARELFDVFMDSNTIEMDVTYDSEDWPNAEWAQFLLIVNSETGGWRDQGRPDTDDVNPGFTSGWDPVNWPGRQTRHVTWIISDTHDGLAGGPGGWFELFIVANYGPAGPGTYYFDNITIGPPGEPESKSASRPWPAPGQSDVRLDPVLTWRPGVWFATQDVYFGTDPNAVANASRDNDLGVLLAGDIAADRLEVPAPLAYEQTYYWRVDTFNDVEVDSPWVGEVWSFTSEPKVYPVQGITATASSFGEDSSPQNLVNGSGLNPDTDGHGVSTSTMWVTDQDANSPAWVSFAFPEPVRLDHMLVWNYNYVFEKLIMALGVKDVRVETSLNGVDWNSLGTHTLAQGTGKSNYQANTQIDLQGVTAQFVRLTIESTYSGTLPAGLSEVRFLRISTRARDPYPVDGATEVPRDVTLDWRASREAAAHRVLLSTDANAVNDGTAPAETLADNAYPLTGLDLGTSYTWRVDEVNEAAVPSVWTGPTWQFTTVRTEMIDDFESYNDDADQGTRIYESWLDGYQDPTNGSQVGHLQSPFAEQVVVHNGRQSMPLYYDNLGSDYSIADYSWSGDLTEGGADSLQLYFRGQVDNDANEPFWVQLTDQSDQVARVTFGQGPGEDISALGGTAWVAWTIPLDSFGIDLQHIKTISIGVGQVDGQPSGRQGLIYIDDLQRGRLQP